MKTMHEIILSRNAGNNITKGEIVITIRRKYCWGVLRYESRTYKRDEENNDGSAVSAGNADDAD